MLEVRNVSKFFGGVVALKDVSIEVKPGEIVGVIGPNGSGKTTLVNIITGYYRPDSGKVFSSGLDITGVEPHKIASQGVARTFQVPKIFRTLTVWENLLAALSYNKSAREKAYENAVKLLKSMELWEKRNLQASALSGGQQRLLEIARALLTNPKVFLLDEPTAGLNPVMIEKLRELLMELKGRGAAMLMVEHNMQVVTSFCDRVVAMSEGAVIANGVPHHVLTSAEVIESYLGS
jgi:branched-chain amino acid transport system ATP-binding protein